MCGIAGIMAYHHAAPSVEVEELDRMGDAMATRGPDGSGRWCSADGRVGMCHRRLSVIDLSDRAAQPMHSADGRLTISFNGEIYNYRQLRQELVQAGIRFTTESDTEVLLHLYAREGESMFARLRGMYAFAIHDRDRGQVLLARDPYGIKPLYYADDGRTLRFASQVKTLLASRGVSRQPDPAGHVGFLMFGSVPEPFTSYQQVRSVPAGSFLWVDGLGPGSATTHFSITACFAQPVGAPDPELASKVAHALKQSMRHHLVADVEVGAFLSSGVDSTTLLGLAAELTDRPIRTITLRFQEFEGQAQDEAPLAAQAAKLYGAPHEVRTVGRQEFESDLPAIMTAMDQPSIDGMNTWFVSKAARELGLKVAFSGTGGDELFGGYPAFRDVPRWVAIMRMPSAVPGLPGLFRAASRFAIRRGLNVSPKFSGMVQYGGRPEGAYFLRRGIFMPWELEPLLPQGMAREGLKRLNPEQHVTDQLDPRPGTNYGLVAAMESTLYLRNQLLRDTDWASMAHGLEVRTPLVDGLLCRELAPLLASQRELDGKALMAASPSPPLPGFISGRRKTGFTTPIQGWLERSQALGAWRSKPNLAQANCHWSRRLAYAVLHEWY